MEEHFNEYYEISSLVVKYLGDDLTAVERQRLNSWLEESKQNRAFFRRLTDAATIDPALLHVTGNDKDVAWANITASTALSVPPKKTRKLKILRYAAVISFLLLSALFVYKYQQPDGPTNEARIQQASKDVPPGGNHATLTLSDGTKILLDDARNGELAHQQNTRITKARDGQLVYEMESSSNQSEHLSINTISTPKGGQFQLILPDGTKVWLNAMSTLKFPVNFSGRERRVELIGEGYFEVSKNREKPFIVRSSGADIRVLGTQFNISAYADEHKMSTTLVEGSVRVTKGKHVVTLEPGMKALCGSSDGVRIAKADVEADIAWKNGYFIFREVPIQVLMATIDRWYDIEVKYEGDMEGKIFGGKFSKGNSLSELLKSLELTGTIKFKMDGRRVTVMP